MPQKTKKQKIQSTVRKETVSHKSEAIAKDEKDTKKSFFVQDISKSLLIIGGILIVEIGLYLAAEAGKIPFIPAV